MKSQSNTRPFIRQFYKGNGIRFALAMIQTVLMTVSCMMVSWLIQQIIDITTGADTGFSFPQIVLLSIFTLLLMFLAYFFAYISKPQLIAKGISQYKEYVFSQMCRKGISAFTGENTSLYISALSNDTTVIEKNYLTNVFVIIDNALLFVGALALMFWYDPLLTVISIGLSFVPLLASVLTGDKVAKAEKQVSDKNESYMSTLRDSLVGFSVIKSFRAEAQICRIYAQKVRAVSDAGCKRQKLSILVEMLGQTAGAIVQIGVMLIGAGMALAGADLSAGSVLVFVQLLNFVLNPIAAIPTALAECKAAKALIRKIADALAENIREDGKEDLERLQAGIAIRDLDFAYERDKPILQNISFTFEAGKRYAIVGASGSGKSTLLNLLLASHADYSGSIYYDTTELRQLRSGSLYEAVSTIQQNVFIFNASIRDNITMFSPFPKAEVDQAIALSGLSDLIAQRGEEYLCGENGSALSGGEKQRISIARSLLKKSQVLLVDEATAALDAKTAFQVTNAILDLEGITRIVVTHALDETLLRKYDCILTLKGGTIAQSGKFDDLMAQKGYFYSLYTISQ